MDTMGPEEVIKSFESALGSDLVNTRIYQREIAVKKNTCTSLWLEVKRDGFRPAIQHLTTLQHNPHFTGWRLSMWGNLSNCSTISPCFTDITLGRYLSSSGGPSQD